MPVHRAIEDMTWQTSIEFLPVAIPMFIMLGEILLRLRSCRKNV
jgi:C4-dicarboxylate transporter DctM subunit